MDVGGFGTLKSEKERIIAPLIVGRTRLCALFVDWIKVDRDLAEEEFGLINAAFCSSNLDDNIVYNSFVFFAC